MTPFRLFSFASASALLVSLVACGGRIDAPTSTSSSASPHGAPDSGLPDPQPSPPDADLGGDPDAELPICQSFELLPAVVVVTERGSLPHSCDFFFSETPDDDAGLAQPRFVAESCAGNQTSPFCAKARVGLDPTSCLYLLDFANLDPNPISVLVTAPGYATVRIDGVHGGAKGCIANYPASTSSIAIDATVDAGS
jgi:hypothetical protein